MITSSPARHAGTCSRRRPRSHLADRDHLDGLDGRGRERGFEYRTAIHAPGPPCRREPVSLSVLRNRLPDGADTQPPGAGHAGCGERPGDQGIRDRRLPPAAGQQAQDHHAGGVSRVHPVAGLDDGLTGPDRRDQGLNQMTDAEDGDYLARGGGFRPLRACPGGAGRMTGDTPPPGWPGSRIAAGRPGAARPSLVSCPLSLSFPWSLLGHRTVRAFPRSG